MPTVQKLTEAAFTRMVLDAARIFGWRSLHIRPGRTKDGWRTPLQGDGKGWPDLFLVRGRQVIAAELKVGRNPVTYEQARWIAALEGAGIPCFVWRPENLDAIEALLREAP